MRVRAISFILVCLLALAALLASNRAKPIVVEAHGGRWLFNEADYSVCTPVPTVPLQPREHGTNLYPRRSDTA